MQHGKPEPSVAVAFVSGLDGDELNAELGEINKKKTWQYCARADRDFDRTERSIGRTIEASDGTGRPFRRAIDHFICKTVVMRSLSKNDFHSRPSQLYHFLLH